MWQLKKTLSTFVFLLMLGLTAPLLAQEITADSPVSIIGFEVAEVSEAPLQIQLVETDTIVRASAARNKYGYTGTGYTAAVIDTGIDYNHTAFAGRYLGGYDFHNNDDDPYDDNGHGTHVAGIIAGDHTSYKGIAPDANIVALKALGSNGSGSFAAVRDSLLWIIDNQETYNIVVVNLSLGSGNYSTVSNEINFLESQFQTLLTMGVTIVVAAGNSFYTYNSAQGLAFPAVSPKVISVGAVYDANVGRITWGSGAIDYTSAAHRITSFTQRNSNLSIVAPGALLTAAYPGGGYTSLGGTSMAAPVVAGAALLMHQAAVSRGRSDLATQARILQFFKDNSPTIYDGDDENNNVTATGNNFHSLNLVNAMDELDELAPLPTATPTVTPTPTPTIDPAATPIPTATATNTPQPTPTAEATPTSTPIIPTPSPTNTIVPSPSPTRTPLPTRTSLPIIPTAVATATPPSLPAIIPPVGTTSIKLDFSGKTKSGNAFSLDIRNASKQGTMSLRVKLKNYNCTQVVEVPAGDRVYSGRFPTYIKAKLKFSLVGKDKNDVIATSVQLTEAKKPKNAKAACTQLYRSLALLR